MIVNKYNTGGGGGGGYTLPTATANRLGGIKVGSGLTVQNDGTLSTSGETYQLPAATDQVLGGVKIGAGISVDSGGTISVAGGGGGGDYMVVSGLPESAENGQLFYVPAHTSLTTYAVYVFDCSGWVGDGNYVVGEGELYGKSIFYSPGDSEYGWFHWDWGENEEDWQHKEGWGYYKVNQPDHIFYAALPLSFVPNFNLNEYVSLTTGTTAFTEDFNEETYRYIAEYNGFRKEKITIDLNNSDIYSLLSQYSEGFLKNNVVFYDSNDKIPYYFVGYDADSDRYEFQTLVAMQINPVGPPIIEGQRTKYVNSSYTEGFSNIVHLPMRVMYDIPTSALTSDTESLWPRAVFDGIEWGGNAITLKVFDGDGKTVGFTQNVWFRQPYDTDNSQWFEINNDAGVMIFGGEWYMYDKKVVAEWAISNEGGVVGGAPLNWTETAAHSAQDSTIPNNS